MADDILKNIPLPADLPENWTSGQIIAPTGAEAGLDNQYGYNYLMMQVNNAQKALKALAAQREEDLAKIKFWVSDDPTSPASFIGGTWERIEDCTIWGASNTHPAGTTVEAGLPNIKGKFSFESHAGEGGWLKVASATGAFGGSKAGAGAVAQAGVNDVGSMAVDMDASKSSKIYGASTTVQPPAYCMYIWRRVA